MEIDQLLPILFGVLFAFIGLNTLLSFVLRLSYGPGIWSRLFHYWSSVFFVFILQALAQGNQLVIILAATASLLPITILGRISFLEFNEDFPLKKLLISYLLAYPFIIIFWYAGLGFTVSAMAGVSVAIVPLILAIRLTLKRWAEASIPQKFLLIPYTALLVHIFNFAFFRMDEGAQLWGWAAGFAIYQMLGVLLPAMLIDQMKRRENERLFSLVNERTLNLREAVERLNTEAEENKNLIKVVLHDISNPLTTLLGRLDLLKRHVDLEEKVEKQINVALTAGDSIRGIINDVRNREGMHLKQRYGSKNITDLMYVLEQLKVIYGPLLAKKNLKMSLSCEVSSDLTFRAPIGETLKNTILSNLLSNSIKFSQRGKEIVIRIKRYGDYVAISFCDSGVGFSKEVLSKVNIGIEPDSCRGTEGEVGTGHGLALVRNGLNECMGELVIEQNEHQLGAVVSIRLKIDSLGNDSVSNDTDLSSERIEGEANL